MSAPLSPLSASDLVLLGDPRLRELSLPVAEFDAQISALAADLVSVMLELGGVGLAAVQLGVMLQMAALLDLDTNEPFVVLNPSLDRPGEPGPLVREQVALEHASLCPPPPDGRCLGHDGFLLGPEGCLSIPGIFAPVVRPDSLVLSGLTPEGEPLRRLASGTLARAAAHELDHMNAVLFLDHLPAASAARLRRLAASGGLDPLLAERLSFDATHASARPS